MYETKTIGADARLGDSTAALPPFKVSRSKTKRIFDVIAAAILFAMAAPVMVLIAMLVRRDGGPAMIKHRRIGADGAGFDCYKFRSMVLDADQVLADMLARDPQLRAEWEADFKLRNDPRVTGIGRILRKTSLDELPQLINVLRGEMSLVGPRPIVAGEVQRYGRYFADYMSCRPGITGLWQVTGRNDVSYDRRVALDAAYARGWSLLIDLRILARTLIVVLRRDGAY
jgi:Undecaprenyl-phosphate galactose phosphotransferase WbaP